MVESWTRKASVCIHLVVEQIQVCLTALRSPGPYVVSLFVLLGCWGNRFAWRPAHTGTLCSIASPRLCLLLGRQAEARGAACPARLIVHSIKRSNGQRRGVECVPSDLTLTEWTGLSVTEGVSEWSGRQYPFPSVSRHSGHDWMQLCRDTAQPRSAPGGPGLTSETSRQHGWSMPSDNKWNNHLLPHPPPLHLPPWQVPPAGEW